MPHNCNYNKASLLVELKRCLWRLDQYKKDADKAGHPLCKGMLEELEQDLHKNVKKLQQAIEGLAKEGKFEFCEKC